MRKPSASFFRWQLRKRRPIVIGRDHRWARPSVLTETSAAVGRRGRPLSKGLLTTAAVRRESRRIRLIVRWLACDLCYSSVGRHSDPLLFDSCWDGTAVSWHEWISSDVVPARRCAMVRHGVVQFYLVHLTNAPRTNRVGEWNKMKSGLSI
jgi:hypothetical protein